MPFKIVRNDIVNMKVDAIVNTANPEPTYGRGTDMRIYKAAGIEALLSERKKIGRISVGDAAITSGNNLFAKYIIHTVGPVWRDGKKREDQLLVSCYKKSLELAKEKGCKSIAFPLISTGVYGFPKEKALQLAIDCFSGFLLNEDIMVYLVVYDKESLRLSNKLFDGIEEFIDNNYVDEFNEYPMLSNMQVPRRSLDDLMNNVGKTFQQQLFRLADERGMKDPQVYRGAGMTKQTYSKIRNDVNYQPKKKTVQALAISLHLNLDEAKDLLESAGYALSPSSKVDLVFEYFIRNEAYDLISLDIALMEHGLPLIGQ